MTPKGPASAGAPRTTLGALAAAIGGRVEGDPAAEVAGAAAVGDAGPREVTFADGARALAAAAAGRAAAVIVAEGASLPGRPLIRVANPRLAFARALAILHPAPRPAAGVHPAAVVADGARVDPTASVGALCHVGAGAEVGPGCVLHPHAFVGEDAVLGAGCVVYPMAVVREGVRLGARVIVHAGAVVGSDGFGYVFDGAAHAKIPQVGTVEVGDDAEIGACAAIDRATTGVTRIGRGVKIDNLVHIGHNVVVGDQAILVGQVGIAGSSTIGPGAVLAGQVGVADHLTVGAGARVAAQAGVIRDVPAGATVGGFGPQPHVAWLRSQATYERLPELRRRIDDLEKRLAAAERALAAAAGEP